VVKQNLKLILQVNVGCIPKKLLHFAGKCKERIIESKGFGWEGIDEKNLKHDWNKLIYNISVYISKLNWKYEGNY
jgi:pyruvate/2-oxoglutarate dehydrogenase complex dihydrolipoamide dehydrogenase (E3) component